MRNLLKRNGYFYFRMRIPKELQGYFNSTEIRKSLKCKETKYVKLLIKALSFKTEKLFNTIKGNMLTDTQIKKLITKYIHETYIDTEKGRAYGIGIPIDDDDLTEQIETYSILSSDYQEDLARNKFKRVEGAVDSILAEHSISIDRDSLEYMKLCRELLKASIAFLRVENQRRVGNYENEYLPASLTLQENSNGQPAKSLAEVVSEYIKEKGLKDKWSTKTKEEYVGIFKVFNEIIKVLTKEEDIAFKSIGKDIVSSYVEILTKLPANINKKKETRNKTIPELLQYVNEHSPEPMAIKTRNKKIELISSLYKWAIKQDYATKNLAEGLTAKEHIKAHEERAIYSKGDLKKLFSSPVYSSKNDGSHPERFYIPLIALYTGMRLEEICQLYLEDIRKIEGIWCFDINEKADKKLKTSSSVRIVPIHPILIKIGFLEYCQYLKDNKRVRLWENLKHKLDKYSKDFGTWFQRYNRKYITSDSKKVFHSFRHTFIDNLKQLDISETIISELVGHSQKSITMGRYGKQYNPKKLYEAVKRVDNGIDLGHLRFPL